MVRAPVSDDIDLLLTPSLMTRQGFLMAAEWTHRVPWGTYDIKASGIYQLDPMAFTFSEAQTNWRGAIQTTGDLVTEKIATIGENIRVRRFTRYALGEEL